MSVMLMLAACGGVGAPVTKTYTSSQPVTIPATVANLVLLSGDGADGTPYRERYVRTYTRTATQYDQRNDLGGEIYETDLGTTNGSGATPAPYCDPGTQYTGFGGVTNSRQVCYTFEDTSGYVETDATTGDPSTGFGKTFPGGVGGPAPTSSFANVAVVGGQSYNLVIPSGGSITISYYE